METISPDTSHSLLAAGDVNGEQTIWRYMDLAKLVAILEQAALFFPSPAAFSDPKEGVVPLPLFASGAQRKLSMPEHLNVGISCWHINPCESDAMWKIYLKSNEGIAILSTPENLLRSLPASVAHLLLVRPVEYTNYEIAGRKLEFPEHRYFLKGKSFAHERELRALLREPGDGEAGLDVTLCERGFSVSCNVQELIGSIYVAPQADTWLRDLIERLVRRYGLGMPVIRSPLYSEP